MTLKELIADTGGHPDEFVITLLDGTKATLGELRGLSAQQRAAITKKETEIATREQTLQQSIATLQDAQGRVAQMYAAVTAVAEKFGTTPEALLSGSVTLPTGANAGGNQPADPFAPLKQYENDNILGPVVKVLKDVASGRASLEDKFNKTLEAIKGMGVTYLQDKLDEQYERVAALYKDGKVPFTREQLVKHAMDNGFNRRGNIPDLVRAHKELSAPTVNAEERTAFAKSLVASVNEGLKNLGIEVKLDDKGQVVMPAVTPETIASSAPGPFGFPRPSAGGIGGMTPDAGAKKFKSLDDAISAAKQDPDIWKNMAAAIVQSGGVQ